MRTLATQTPHPVSGTSTSAGAVPWSAGSVASRISSSRSSSAMTSSRPSAPPPSSLRLRLRR
eukprot:12727446-Alexandrium_andersonii.AAC.1